MNPTSDTQVWIPDPDATMYDSDVGGDEQATRSFDRRFWHRDQHGVLLNVAFYGVDVRYRRNNPPPENEPPEYQVCAQYEFMVCSDPNDPGGTEIWSDVRYATDERRTYTDPDEVTEAARAAALAYEPTNIYWEGIDDHDPDVEDHDF